ncbi:MAG: hypothetical protein H0T89_36920 [Deltaproteobacteria bacterium]|nr:hypothetical protein [Deltaproteobacteria bacterium]MDQ3298880.1 hypothetical protein [Myxococcota bacterium]
MRAEDKQLEGPELEREQRVDRPQAHEEEEMPVLAGEEVRDVGMDHRSHLLDALQLILAGEQVNLGLLYLPRRETLALEALHAAVHGSDSVGEFVFAEDRRSLLEQALAVLQANLTYGEPAQLAELQSKFGLMTGQLAELREQLSSLEDAQEERDEFHNAAKLRGEGSDGEQDDDEKPKPKSDEDKEPTLADFVSTLTGPARPEPAKPPSMLEGPAGPEPAKPPSMLAGPELPAPPPHVSTLADDSPSPISGRKAKKP